MIDHNSVEEVEKRANQEAPIVMYLIVRESLNMPIGKACAQCAHGSQMILLHYFKDHLKYKQDPKYIGIHPTDEELDRWETLEAWLKGSFRKVVLRASDKEFEKIKNELPKEDYQLVIDAGLTVLQPGTETVIAIYPMYKSEVPKLIKRLQVLK